MNNFQLLKEEMELPEGIFDIVQTLKRTFSNFRTNVTKRGMTIDVEEYETEGIYTEILSKAASLGFKSMKADPGYKYEFVAGTEMFKVKPPKAKAHVTTIELEFNIV